MVSPVSGGRVVGYRCFSREEISGIVRGRRVGLSLLPFEGELGRSDCFFGAEGMGKTRK